MRKLLITPMLILLLFSCKITRYTATETQTATVEQKEISEQTTETKTENTLTEIDEKENIKITVFSAPDSSGNQHVVSVTEISRDKTSSSKKNSVAEKETLHSDKSKTQKSEIVKVTEKSETKTKTPCWVYLLVVILGFGVIYLIIRILRRYKVL
jgi:cobalamin biosynthesis Mg chelatase CobN